MTKISSKNVVETWLGLLGAGDMKAVTEMFADDAVIDMPGTRKYLGPEGGRVRQRLRNILELCRQH